MMWSHDGKIRWQGDGEWDLQIVSSTERPVYELGRVGEIIWCCVRLYAELRFSYWNWRTIR